jgi:pimeloyl-ACP methyl ester carboxylesterase
MQSLELILKLVLGALCLALVALAFVTEHIVKRQCLRLLVPVACKSYDGAVDAIPLQYNFGTLVKYEGDEPSMPPCLFVHSGYGNVNHWLHVVKLAAKNACTVYALEPRGFGADSSKTSVATFILAVKFAMAKLRQILPEGQHPNLLGVGLGGQLARFANHAFGLDAP